MPKPSSLLPTSVISLPENTQRSLFKPLITLQSVTSSNSITLLIRNAVPHMVLHQPPQFFSSEILMRAQLFTLVNGNHRPSLAGCKHSQSPLLLSSARNTSSPFSETEDPFSSSSDQLLMLNQAIQRFSPKLPMSSRVKSSLLSLVLLMVSKLDLLSSSVLKKASSPPSVFSTPTTT